MRTEIGILGWNEKIKIPNLQYYVLKIYLYKIQHEVSAKSNETFGYQNNFKIQQFHLFQKLAK